MRTERNGILKDTATSFFAQRTIRQAWIRDKSRSSIRDTRSFRVFPCPLLCDSLFYFLKIIGKVLRVIKSIQRVVRKKPTERNLKEMIYT